MRIIDCFIFYNELDLLTYRLNLLDDIVDYFIIVESTHTFVGKEILLTSSHSIKSFGQLKDVVDFASILHMVIQKWFLI
jgi:beta-1,4-mannosyl-glycoprotein beta-1,4-N-acetylglucosaminyltransferase